MQIITGTHPEKTGRKDRDGSPETQAVVDTVRIPDEPRALAEFPKEAIAAVSKPDGDGNVVVVTVDGKKFRGIRAAGGAIPRGAAEKDADKPKG